MKCSERCVSLGHLFLGHPESYPESFLTLREIWPVILEDEMKASLESLSAVEFRFLTSSTPT
jgi:hypothetical protein